MDSITTVDAVKVVLWFIHGGLIGAAVTISVFAVASYLGSRKHD